MIKHIIALIILYLFINNPRLSLVGGMPFLYFFYPLTLLCLNKNVLKLLKANMDIIMAYAMLILFTIFRTFLGGEFSFVTQTIGSLLANVFLPLLFVNAIIHYRLSFNKLILWFGWSCVIITLLCLFFPEINNYIKFSLTVQSEAGLNNLYRGFGLSGSLSSGYGTVLTVVVLYLVEKRLINIYNVILILLIVLAILINARTGLISLFSVIAIFMVLNPSTGLKMGGLAILLFILSPFFFELSFLPEETASWIEEFFYQIQDSITGTSNSKFNTSEELIENHIVWPRDTYEWFLGRGYNIFDVGNENSDIGFIRQLNYGGLVYLALLLLSFYKIIKKSSQLFVILCSLSIMLIANSKGDFLSAQDGYRLLCLIILYLFVQNKVRKNI